jgi:hypothetical protein
MSDIHTPQELRELPLALVKSMAALATSGFGLVVALAWNEFIKKVVEEFINPYLGRGSSTVSLLIYAVIMTILAVVITMQLATLQKKLELIEERYLKKKKDC